MIIEPATCLLVQVVLLNTIFIIDISLLSYTLRQYFYYLKLKYRLHKIEYVLILLDFIQIVMKCKKYSLCLVNITIKYIMPAQCLFPWNISQQQTKLHKVLNKQYNISMNTSCEWENQCKYVKVWFTSWPTSSCLDSIKSQVIYFS